MKASAICGSPRTTATSTKPAHSRRDCQSDDIVISDLLRRHSQTAPIAQAAMYSPAGIVDWHNRRPARLTKLRNATHVRPAASSRRKNGVALSSRRPATHHAGSSMATRAAPARINRPATMAAPAYGSGSAEIGVRVEPFSPPLRPRLPQPILRLLDRAVVVVLRSHPQYFLPQRRGLVALTQQVEGLC